MSTIKLRRKAAPNAYFERKGSKLTSLEADQNLIELYNLLGGAQFSTGDMLASFATSKTGWVAADGSTIGSASSGATSRANSDTQTLYELIWNNTSNSDYQVQNSSGVGTTRGGSAAIDFAANKRIPLPDMRGRAVIGAGTGSGLTLRESFKPYGAETVDLAHTHAVGTLATASGGAHTHTVSGTIDSGGAHTHSVSGTSASSVTGITINDHTTGNTAEEGAIVTAKSVTHSINDSGHTHTISITSGSGGSHTHTHTLAADSGGAHTHTLSGSTASTTPSGSVIQPSLCANMFIKL